MWCQRFGKIKIKAPKRHLAKYGLLTPNIAVAGGSKIISVDHREKTNILNSVTEELHEWPQKSMIF